MVCAAPPRVGQFAFQRGAVIHQRVVPFAGIRAIEGGLDKGHDFGVSHVPAVLVEKVNKHRANIRLNKGIGSMKSERPNG